MKKQLTITRYYAKTITVDVDVPENTLDVDIVSVVLNDKKQVSDIEEKLSQSSLYISGDDEWENVSPRTYYIIKHNDKTYLVKNDGENEKGEAWLEVYNHTFKLLGRVSGLTVPTKLTEEIHVINFEEAVKEFADTLI